MKIAMLGHMGWDEAAAERLTDHKLHILGQLDNPGLLEKSAASGGQCRRQDAIQARVADR